MGKPDHIQSAVPENVATPPMFPNPAHLFHYIPAYVAAPTQALRSAAQKIRDRIPHLFLFLQKLRCSYRQPSSFTAPGTGR